MTGIAYLAKVLNTAPTINSCLKEVLRVSNGMYGVAKVDSLLSNSISSVSV